MGSKKDFFISYTKTDEQWAEWIAFQLENKGYNTIIQAWDFKPGTNFVSNMHNALIDCERLLNGISTDDRPRNRPGCPGTLNKPKFPGQLPFNNLPFRKNLNFTGREDILEGIQKSFKQEQYTSLAQSVLGLGGVGKTQIVLEYAFRYGYLYDTIWWVNSENSLTLMESYSNFAHKNNLINKDTNEEVIRKSIDKGEWLEYGLNIICRVLRFDHKNPNTWDKCSEVVPHALSVAKHSDRLHVDLEKVAWIYNEASMWLQHTAGYEEAEPLFKRALEINEKVLGAKHPDTANSLNNLAELYDNQGRHKEAELLRNKL